MRMSFQEIFELVKPRLQMDVNRARSLYSNAGDAASLQGEFWECGVFRGGSARILAEVLRYRPRHLRLFDTFSGFPNINSEDGTYPKKGMFTATSVEDVRGFVNADFAILHPGTIPDTFAGLEDSRIAFAHIDVDLYEPTKAALEFVLPRMVEGGVVIVDDFADSHWPGAAKAVVEIAVDRFHKELKFYNFGKHDRHVAIL
jgi:O-methyltransferase